VLAEWAPCVISRMPQSQYQSIVNSGRTPVDPGPVFLLLRRPYKPADRIVELDWDTWNRSAESFWIGAELDENGHAHVRSLPGGWRARRNWQLTQHREAALRDGYIPKYHRRRKRRGGSRRSRDSPA
jgi:hypothetical protein